MNHEDHKRSRDLRFFFVIFVSFVLFFVNLVVLFVFFVFFVVPDLLVFVSPRTTPSGLQKIFPHVPDFHLVGFTLCR